MEDYEKLGAFYLGRTYDLAHKKLKEDLLLYDSKDLVTHAVCIGMTGSGKTGLCLDLIEEAAIDGIPVIAIDPKGDIGNLLLTFPKLQPEDFEPWVNADEARRNGLSVPEFATEQSQTWKKGLAEWGQDGKRIAKLRQSADFAIYTPGSSAGIPVSIVNSLQAPPGAVLEDSDALRERISATTAGLMGLLGIEGDPLRSREHILLSNILSHHWKQGKNLDLAGLIAEIQNPPFSQVGALNIEGFFPAKDRFELAMTVNNLLASPGFETWLEGAPLDIDQILYSEAGKPRVAIFSIGHLSDSERMFFVTLLLNQVLGWMRAQSGTTSLRAILYMDEIFGYFPPVANPPSKTPLLTLLKQARAFGLGLVLATQNPVDLDYKGLSNTGTWFIGRLQTERDKARLIDGLEGAASGTGQKFDRGAMTELIAGLGKRVFLMNNVHDDEPVIFQTRWSMSYLRGPLAKNEIKRLTRSQPILSREPPIVEGDAMHRRFVEDGDSGDAWRRPPQIAGPQIAGPQIAGPQIAPPKTVRPMLPPGIPQYFLPPDPTAAQISYIPTIIGVASVRYVDTKTATDFTRDSIMTAPIDPAAAVHVDWNAAKRVNVSLDAISRDPAPGATFAPLPAIAGDAKSYTGWSKDFVNWLFANRELKLLQSPSTGLVSRPGESERDFRVRLQQAGREKRDLALQKLKEKYAPKINSVQEKLRHAESTLQREQWDVKEQQMQSAISVGSTLLGAFVGRRSSTISQISSAARGGARVMKQQDDVARAQANVEALNNQLRELEAQFRTETETVSSTHDPLTEKMDVLIIKPKKTNITVKLVAMAWVPA